MTLDERRQMERTINHSNEVIGGSFGQLIDEALTVKSPKVWTHHILPNYMRTRKEQPWVCFEVTTVE